MFKNSRNTSDNRLNDSTCPVGHLNFQSVSKLSAHGTNLHGEDLPITELSDIQNTLIETKNIKLRPSRKKVISLTRTAKAELSSEYLAETPEILLQPEIWPISHDELLMEVKGVFSW